MPTFGDLQKRLKRHNQACVRLGTDEILIADDRAAMRPGDFVEAKLRAAQPAIGPEYSVTSREGGFPDASLAAGQ